MQLELLNMLNCDYAIDDGYCQQLEVAHWQLKAKQEQACKNSPKYTGPVAHIW